MEIRDTSDMRAVNLPGGRGVTVISLHPGRNTQGLVAVDLLEIAPGGSTGGHRHGEEHIIYVVDGAVEVSGTGSSSSVAGTGAVVYIAAGEQHSLRNSGNALARLLVSTPLLVRSERVPLSGDAMGEEVEAAPRGLHPRQTPPERSAASPAAPVTPPRHQVAELAVEMEEGPPPDISGLMKRGSDLVGAPRPERRRPPAPVEDEVPKAAQPEADEEEVDEEAQSNLMELFVAFEGGVRDKPPGQGFGSYLVQAPNRRPVVRRVEFGDNFTLERAQYAALTACVEYIIERLSATGRTPDQVQLDLRSDSNAIVDQLMGEAKVRDAALRRHMEEAKELLDRFAHWQIEWHEESESVRLLGG